MPPTIRDMVQRMSRNELEQFCSQLHDASIETVRWLLTDDNTLRFHYLRNLQTVIDLSPWLTNEESEAFDVKQTTD
jgi:glutathionylspermidine synthase